MIPYSIVSFVWHTIEHCVQSRWIAATPYCVVLITKEQSKTQSTIQKTSLLILYFLWQKLSQGAPAPVIFPARPLVQVARAQ